MQKNNSEFWDGLSDSIAKTARGIGEKAEFLYETQKLRSRISGEERVIQKIKTDLGNIIYQLYLQGQELSEEQRVLCEQIEQHENCIERYKKKMSNMKKKKICPSCKRALDITVAFCPYCGVACPDEETEENGSESEVVSEAVITEGEEKETVVEEAEHRGETEDSANDEENDTKQQ